MGNTAGAVGLLSAAFRSDQICPKSGSPLTAAVGTMLAIALAESGDLPASCGAAQAAAAAASAACVEGDVPCTALAWMTLADIYARNGRENNQTQSPNILAFIDCRAFELDPI